MGVTCSGLRFLKSGSTSSVSAVNEGHRRRTGKVYVPLDVDYWQNPRIMAAGARAEHLYVRALCFAKHTLSDGHLTPGQVAACARGLRNWRSLAEKLVEAGLWEPTADGWHIVGFLERNRSRREIDDLSEKRAQAGRTGGFRSGESRSNEQRTDTERTANEQRVAANAKQVASKNLGAPTENAERTISELNPRQVKSETETYLRDGFPQSVEDSLCGAFTSERDKTFALNDVSGEPVDTLKRRCLDIFVAKGVSRDDCCRAVDRLRADNIADELIDMALGQCERNPDVRHIGYLVSVARDWYAQRTGTRNHLDRTSTA
jgi:hypothetical protein